MTYTPVFQEYGKVYKKKAAPEQMITVLVEVEQRMICPRVEIDNTRTDEIFINTSLPSVFINYQELLADWEEVEGLTVSEQLQDLLEQQFPFYFT